MFECYLHLAYIKAVSSKSIVGFWATRLYIVLILNKINQSNIKILPTQSNKTKLIKHYDDHNIFVLPSFTEGHPMVLLEALARRRPVIIFDEIKHVIGDKKGIFVTRRNFLSFLGTLNNIKKNYKKIQKDMKKNKLPTNKEFIEKFIKLIDDFN